MTEAEKKKLEAAMAKALALQAKVDAVIDGLPADRQESTRRMKMAANSMMTNLAMAMKMAKG